MVLNLFFFSCSASHLHFASVNFRTSLACLFCFNESIKFSRRFKIYFRENTCLANFAKISSSRNLISLEYILRDIFADPNTDILEVGRIFFVWLMIHSGGTMRIGLMEEHGSMARNSNLDMQEEIFFGSNMARQGRTLCCLPLSENEPRYDTWQKFVLSGLDLGVQVI